MRPSYNEVEQRFCKVVVVFFSSSCFVAWESETPMTYQKQLSSTFQDILHSIMSSAWGDTIFRNVFDWIATACAVYCVPFFVISVNNQFILNCATIQNQKRKIFVQKAKRNRWRFWIEAKETSQVLQKSKKALWSHKYQGIFITKYIVINRKKYGNPLFWKDSHF